MASPDDKRRIITCEMAAIAGGVLLLLILLIAGWEAFDAFILGVLFAVALWLICKFGFGGELPIGKRKSGAGSGGMGTGAPAASSAAPSASSATTASSPVAPSAASAPTAAEASSAVSASPELPGEAELAERKGEWRYSTADTEAETDSAEEEPAEVPTPPADMPDVADTPAADAAPEVDGVKPEFMTEAREGGPDDLKQIKGVGPKLEGLLHELGVFHFDQIAVWGPPEVAWMDGNLAGFKGRVSRDEWVAQAKILAAGGETDFSKKVDKGGVY